MYLLDLKARELDKSNYHKEVNYTEALESAFPVPLTERVIFCHIVKDQNEQAAKASTATVAGIFLRQQSTHVNDT
jgi:hypothetical protein